MVLKEKTWSEINLQARRGSPSLGLAGAQGLQRRLRCLLRPHSEPRAPEVQRLSTPNILLFSLSTHAGPMVQSNRGCEKGCGALARSPLGFVSLKDSAPEQTPQEGTDPKLGFGKTLLI